MYPTLTHAHDGEIVVFNIGMTIRKPHRPDLWLPVLRAMAPMLRELYANKEAAERGEAEHLGFLGAQTLMSAKGPWVVQYWRSSEDLYNYAHLNDREHLPAWRAFNKAARANPGAAGIWHETYVIPAGGIESVYANGAEIGLGKALGTVPVNRRGAEARQRLGSKLSA
ncbi:MAG: DUF4188 domain-containing protein [Dermatophilus congolensis]|nr:DUF4188 domain-containing protein [Dermatophilus congolensis]